MFLKYLKISTENFEIRNIKFRKGINLIVDESKEQITGNNVGKTTVLKLIDFCLGGDAKQIYIDPETKRDEYKLVKDFLVDEEVIITLVLSEDIEDGDSNEIVIERNFLQRNKAIRRVNGEDLTVSEFESRLQKLVFPEHYDDKPSFRQIASHNIRYKDESINNTLKTLNKYTSDAEYETLYLFLLGVDFDKGNSRQEILEKLKHEHSYKKRLEKKQTKTAYETALALINDDIENLNKKKENLNINENFESDLNHLNEIKYEINKVSGELSKWQIRRNLILEAKDDLNSSKADIDLKQLKLIYQQATKRIDGIQKTFDELVSYHNQMADEKIKFITKDLPDVEDKLKQTNSRLKKLLNQEEELSIALSNSDSYEQLEELITKLNEQYRQKGEYENMIQQLEEVDESIEDYEQQLQEIDEELFSDNFEEEVKQQVNKFNKYFASISERLYGEKYALKYDIITNKHGQKLYKFSSFNTNLSSGKKQGEISCFDIAYILFADDENIPCLHFLLNDKKELMHDNQLVKIANLVNENGIQFIASILKDKLPSELNREDYFIVKLSQEHKLFRIERS